MKGDVARCRWVLREFRDLYEMEAKDLFCATPSNEANNMIDIIALRNDWFLVTIDLTTAFLHAEENELIYTTAPAGYEREGFAVQALRKLNGRRDGSHVFTEWLAGVIQSLGGKRCRVNPSVFVFFVEGIGPAQRYVLFYIDDGKIAGLESDINIILKGMNEILLYTEGVTLTPASRGEEVQTMLSREYRRYGHVMTRRASPKFSRKLSALLRVTDCEPVEVPHLGKWIRKPEDDESCTKDEHRLYRGGMGIFQYIAPERIESQFTHKRLSRKLCDPNAGDMKELKHLARFLENTQDLVTRYEPVGEEAVIFIDVDSDWAKCQTTRKSVDCVITTWQNCMISGSVLSQSSPADSSGLAEFNGIHRGAITGVYLINTLREWGIDVTALVRTDSSAALAMASRLGPGKVRHLSIKSLFLQELVRRNRVQIEKQPGVHNRADIGTKDVDKTQMYKCLEQCQVVRQPELLPKRLNKPKATARRERFDAQWRISGLMLGGCATVAQAFGEPTDYYYSEETCADAAVTMQPSALTLLSLGAVIGLASGLLLAH